MLAEQGTLASLVEQHTTGRKRLHRLACLWLTFHVRTDLDNETFRKTGDPIPSRRTDTSEDVLGTSVAVEFVYFYLPSVNECSSNAFFLTFACVYFSISTEN